MSLQITTAFVNQFGANIDLLSQQKESRFMGKVRMESQNGEIAFYEQIGATAAIERTSRHSDTPRVDTPHSCRAVTLSDFEWADLIDQADKVRMLIDPTSSYAKSAMMAMNRSRDDVMIAAALGTAKTGKNGTTDIVLPSDQKIVHNSTGLTLAKLREAAEILNSNDVDPDINRYMAITSKQLTNLLGTTEITSSDYAAVKALVEGKVDTFMGFKFVRTERLTTDGDGNRQIIAWAEDGLLLAQGSNNMTRVSERDDKSYSVQVFRSECFGATRMEEEKVVEIACTES
jgi:hypothetical protein